MSFLPHNDHAFTETCTKIAEQRARAIKRRLDGVAKIFAAHAEQGVAPLKEGVRTTMTLQQAATDQLSGCAAAFTHISEAVDAQAVHLLRTR